MRIMVLGSSGHIGSALVKKLREEKTNTVVKWDVRDKPTMHDLTLGALGHTLYMAMKEVDYVYFLAEDSSSNSIQQLDANLRIILNVFAAIGATKKPFMYATYVFTPLVCDVSKLVGEKYAHHFGGTVYTFDSPEKVDNAKLVKVVDELVALLPE